MDEELWCDTHGMFHFTPGDVDCKFRDGFGELIEGEG